MGQTIKIQTMKTPLLLLNIILFVSLQSIAQVKHALFIGNSYTGVNNLPQMVADVALSAGDTLFFDSNTPGGYTFQGHTTNSISQNKIMLGNYNFVVLQEQSQLPSFSNTQVQQQVFPYARMLDSVINVYNPCGETMFYMTWGRKNGDAGNCPVWPPVCTYAGMDSLLQLRYNMMADSNNAVVSAVGAVWNYIRQFYPSIELYQSDESHPSLAGSYAAACCFYTSMYRKSPLLITNDYTLPTTDAANIRAAVKTVVYDSLLKWNIGTYDPIADFSSNNNALTVNFSNLSSNASTIFWFFGDGNFSNTASPTHTYASAGTYLVTLIASHCNASHTISKSITVTTTAINETQLQTTLKVYPNPAGPTVTLEANHHEIGSSFALCDSRGKEMISGTINAIKTVINTQYLPNGIYILKLNESVKQKISIINY